jgi:hypothetical protein
VAKGFGDSWSHTAETCSSFEEESFSSRVSKLMTVKSYAQWNTSCSDQCQRLLQYSANWRCCVDPTSLCLRPRPRIRCEYALRCGIAQAHFSWELWAKVPMTMSCPAALLRVPLFLMTVIWKSIVKLG